MIRYIGGEYIQKDIEPFTISNGNINNVFPARIDDSNRFFFETASDGIAAILNENASGPKIKLHYPENFCIATLNLISEKTSCEIELISYCDVSALLRNKTEQKEVLLVVHFNSIHNNVLERFPELLSNYIVIEDFVQYPFHIILKKAHYAVNSLRKVLPLELSLVYGIYSEKSFETSVSEYFQSKKNAIGIKDKFYLTEEPHLEKEYLSEFMNAEAKLYNKKIYLSQISEIEKIYNIDTQKILEQRRSNYNYLYGRIVNMDEVQVVPGEYMFMMILTKARDELRAFLFKEGIYTSIHWADSNSEISKNVLSIPIDQRYKNEDMDRIVFHLRQFFTLK